MVKPTWVDKLCIDQDNILEKNHQVSMMGDIYRHAFEVLIWLGETDEMTTEAIKWLNYIDDLPLEQRPLDFLEERFSLGLAARMALVAPIAKRRWFQRVWTLQEYALASHDPIFLYGEQTFAATQLARLVDEHFSERGTTDDEPRPVDSTQSLYVPKGFRDFSKDRTSVDQDMMHLIWPRLYMRCVIQNSIKVTGRISLTGIWSLSALTRTSLAHDYVYGLLGLMDEEHQSHIVVDYDLEPDEVYRQYMTQLLSTCFRNFAYQFDNTTFQDPGSRHPSWVPDLARQDRIGIIHGGRDAPLTAPSRVITTVSNLLALSCLYAKVDDVLVYFYGFEGPFLVRPRGDHYAIVGWANIAAIESGQDMRHYCETHDVPEVTFRIG
ncbi:hypothetical protein LTR86_008794 [Recurvomyces mirabilis]|nr:hypothetical protein LTR86_008794 [Recurvomyces mirabilis]